MRILALILLVVGTVCGQQPETLLLSIPRPSADEGSAPPSSLTTNLVAYWNLDETTGTRADATGRGNDLTDNLSVGYAAGKVGNCAVLVSNTTQNLQKTDTADLSVDYTSWTFAGWTMLYTTNIPQGFGSKFQTTGSAREYSVMVGNGQKLAVMISTNGASSGNTTVQLGNRSSTNNWFFWAVVHDTNTAKLTFFARDLGLGWAEWKTNQLATPSGYSGNGTASFYLGYGNNGSSPTYFDGKIDEVGFWKRPLTSNEIGNLFDYGNNGTNYPWTGLP